MFLDESGFLLIPTRRRTWGPKGQPPLTRYNYRHDRISALGALTVSAKRKRMGLYLRFQEKNFNAVAAAKFLRLLLRHLPGPVVILWDNGRIHRGPVIRALHARFPRLHMEYFPGYTPELNPVEWLWSNLDAHMGNMLLLNTQALRQVLHQNKRRVASSQQLLRSFVQGSDLPSMPW